MTERTTNILGMPSRELSFLDAFTTITSAVTGAIDTYSQASMEKYDARIRAQQMMAEVRHRARKSAANAAAVLSVASIDISSGTARALINKSLNEANKEVSRILRTTI